MILTQYRPHSLNEHIASGRPWDLDRSFTGGVQIYQPYRGRAATDWYKGTADAIAQNLSFVERGSPDLVLVLSGDHIYKMNYGWLIALPHREAGRRHDRDAERDARGGHAHGHPRDRRRAARHPVRREARDPPGTLASMGIYVFGRDDALAGARARTPGGATPRTTSARTSSRAWSRRACASSRIRSRATGSTSEPSRRTGRRRWTCSRRRRRST